MHRLPFDAHNVHSLGKVKGVVGESGGGWRGSSRGKSGGRKRYVGGGVLESVGQL